MQLGFSMPRRNSVALVVIALALAGPATTVADDDWYVISISASPVGSLHSVLKEDNGQRIQTQELRIVLNRLGSRAEIASTIETREDASGRLVGVTMELDASSQATTMKAVIEPGRVRISNTAGGATFDRELEYTGDLLGPTGIRELIRMSLKRVGDKVAYKTFRADLGLVLDLELELMAISDGVYRVDERPGGKSLAAGSGIGRAGRGASKTGTRAAALVKWARRPPDFDRPSVHPRPEAA